MIDLLTRQKISLDTNIFICSLNENDSRQEKALHILRQIKENGIEASISVVVLEEFFVRFYKQNNDKNISSLLDFITIDGLIIILDINQEIALLAANLRAKYSTLRAPDALHLASAIESGAKVFITTDRRLPKKIGKLTVKVLA